MTVVSGIAKATYMGSINQHGLQILKKSQGSPVNRKYEVALNVPHLFFHFYLFDLTQMQRVSSLFDGLWPILLTHFLLFAHFTVQRESVVTRLLCNGLSKMNDHRR